MNKKETNAEYFARKSDKELISSLKLMDQRAMRIPAEESIELIGSTELLNHALTNGDISLERFTNILKGL